MSKAERRALDWLARHSGQATLDRFGRAVSVKGEVCNAQPVTFLRLASRGLIAAGILQPGGIGITMAGLAAFNTGAAHG